MTDQLTAAEMATLRDVARRAVAAAVNDGVRLRVDPSAFAPPLRTPAAVFVTVRRDGALRGCVGTMSAAVPLVQVTADRARAAATEDPRFEPVAPAELVALQVEVSVLSPMEDVSARSYDELVGEIRAGIDGLLVEAGRHRATFLPAVWQELPEPSSFVAALWHKAGLRPGAWPRGITVRRYRTQHS